MEIIYAVREKTQSKIAMRKVMDYVAQDKKTMLLFPTLFCSNILEVNCIENFQLRPWDSVPNPGIYRFSSPKREKQP